MNTDGNGRYAVVGRYDVDLVGIPGTVRWSDNTVDWNQATIGTSTPFPLTYYTDVIYLNGTWYLGDDIGNVYTSSDAKQWTLRYTDATARFVERFAYGNGVYVVVGDQVASNAPGLVATSTDGITWTPRAVTINGSNNLGVAYSPTQNRWVIVGGSGNVYYTSNPTGTWTSIPQGASPWYYVLWSTTLSLFIACGSAGTIMTSPDGITWTPRTSGVSTSLWSITQLNNGDVVACGSAGTLIRSTNGTTWSNVPTSPPDTVNTYYGVFADSTNLYVFGDTGYAFKTPIGSWTWTYVATELSAATPTIDVNSTFDQTSSYLRLMNGTIGTAQQTISNLSAPLSTAQTALLAMFGSYPLNGPQTVGGGSITLNTAKNGSSAAAQFQVNSFNVYVWRPSTASIVGYVRDAGGTQLANNPGGTGETVTQITGITSSAVNALAGDIIVCEVWATWTQSMGTSYTVNFCKYHARCCGNKPCIFYRIYGKLKFQKSSFPPLCNLNNFVNK
jgi:photosystem II stability/assembly factor-like uncharacterized protein